MLKVMKKIKWTRDIDETKIDYYVRKAVQIIVKYLF